MLAALTAVLGIASARVPSAPPVAVAAPGRIDLPTPPTAPRAELPVLDHWESFTTRDGLPDDHVFCIRRDGDRIWAGTASGLGLFEGGRWRKFGVAEGLPHRVVLSLDVNPGTGDLWIGTMAGLARLSAGRFDVFNQLNSGLPNDVVNGVRYNPEEDALWAATAMGAGRLDLRTGAWSIYTQENTPMHEPWPYSVAAGEGHVYVGAW